MPPRVLSPRKGQQVMRGDCLMKSKRWAWLPLLWALPLLALACGGDGQPAGPREVATTMPSAPATGKIAFLSDRVTDELFDVGIYVADADGSNLTRIPVEVVVQGHGGLVWSPDGSRIAYSFASGRADHEFFTAHGIVLPSG
jgi:hypothetical protein